MADDTNLWADARWRFIEAGGRTTQSFGLSRMVGQAYVLLYLSSAPLCLDDIASGLAVSKASVCTAVRQLESFRAVKKLWIKGDRKDYYEAETDLAVIMRNGLMENIRKKLETAGEQLELVEASVKQNLKDSNGHAPEDLSVIGQRLKKARQFHSRLDSLLNNPLVGKIL